MLTQLRPGLQRFLLLILLALSLNLVLTKAAWGHEVIIMLAPGTPIPAGPVQAEMPIQVFILMSHNSRTELSQVQSYLITNGGRTVHVFPYQALIAAVPAHLVQPLAYKPGVALVSTQTLELAALENYGPTARIFANAWNNLIAPEPTAQNGDLKAKVLSDHPTDAFIAPDLPPAGESIIAAEGSVTPGYYQTSEYLAGSIAVGIILVESNSSHDPSSEDWTPDEKQLVFSEIMNGLNWWTQLEPRAQLSFVYDDHFSDPLPTGVEPITRPYFDQQLWIAEAMGALGYKAPSYFTSVRDYNNALRAAYQTDWAFTIFVVDSSVDLDNRFSDGFFAYAYLGGPFLVLTSENNGYGATNMDAVVAHEMGHIFYALDQYSGAAQSCDRRSGYLYIKNSNSQYGNCPADITSIMRGQVYPYSARAIDPYAAGQVGWRDSDRDDVLDPLDVELKVTLDKFIIDTSNLTASGMAEIIPYPSPSRASVTINKLKSILYRFDQNAWQQATAGDGAFDETTESYSLTIPTPPPGLHTLEIVALDSLNNRSKPALSRTFITPDSAGGGPNTRLYSPVYGLTNQSVAVTGVAYHTQLSGVITAVKYRINGGPWQQIQAADGSFDTNYEPFTLYISPAEATTYLVEAFAIDAAGQVETRLASQIIQVSQPPAITLFFPVISKGG